MHTNQKDTVSAAPAVRLLINENEFATALDVSVTTIRAWRANGVGPKPVRIGRLVKYNAAEVAEFVEKLTKDRGRHRERI